MSKLKFKHWLSTGTALVGLGVLATALPAAAATSTGSSAKARYLRQIEQCRTMKDHDSRANCLSEASTAYAQTQPTPPQENPMQLARNALRRCDPVPEPDHSDCVARVNGAAMADGSVAGGGILYTMVTRETAPVAQANAPSSTTPSTSAPLVPESLPPTGAGPTPAARPATPPIEPAPADVPPTPPVPPQPPRSPGAPNPPGSGS